MKVSILTLFPDSFRGFLESSIIGRAIKKDFLSLELVNLRDFATDKYGSVDDTPYGGGPGMILRVDVLSSAIKQLRSKESLVILLSPSGQVFSQSKARELAKYDHLILISGRYEGFDDRIRHFVDEEISIGDFVLTGGELPAAVVTDAVVRLLPGVLGKDESSMDESFSEGLLEFPQYTKPQQFEGYEVPKILLSGNHAEIKKWRHDQAIKRTASHRPDLKG